MFRGLVWEGQTGLISAAAPAIWGSREQVTRWGDLEGCNVLAQVGHGLEEVRAPPAPHQREEGGPGRLSVPSVVLRLAVRHALGSCCSGIVCRQPCSSELEWRWSKSRAAGEVL